MKELAAEAVPKASAIIERNSGQSEVAAKNIRSKANLMSIRREGSRRETRNKQARAEQREQSKMKHTHTQTLFFWLHSFRFYFLYNLVF